jgi:hypothetical protein
MLEVALVVWKANHVTMTLLILMFGKLRLFGENMKDTVTTLKLRRGLNITVLQFIATAECKKKKNKNNLYFKVPVGSHLTDALLVK